MKRTSEKLFLILAVFLLGTGCSKKPPTVSTNQATNIATTSATSGGKVLEDGNADVSIRGVCWSTNQSPTVNDNKTMDGSGIGSFTSSITQLTPNTMYYVKAYATNSEGTGYGNTVSFTTNPLLLASVTTSSVTNVTPNSAEGGGNVTADGGAEVTARGVCWNTLPNPTTSNFKTTNGSGLGSFTSSITGLQPGTTYYLRAYATNIVGPSYGEEINFSTPAIKPSVTTNTVTEITSSSAKSGGNITSDGGTSITSRGVCWSTSQNPTPSGAHTEDGAGTGSFNSILSDLLPNTYYYVRAYATNSVGTSYGNQVGFTTEPLTDFDGNTYQTVTIGTQVWMAENLNTTKYRDGTPIQHVMNNDTWIGLTTGAFCWWNNDPATYEDTYGALYNWYAVVDSRNLCPAGWHIPTVGEWLTLANYLGGQGAAGGKMKETGFEHWDSPNNGATNESGFTALSSGYRLGSTGGYFNTFGEVAYWWSSSEYSTTDAWFLYIRNDWANLYTGNFLGKICGFSVRCVKD
jgi:uncharacterized protein (TIGR02145 family)